MKRLLTVAVALAATIGLLATQALGTTAPHLTYPSTTTGCTSENTISECWTAAGAGGTVTIKPGKYNTYAAGAITLDHAGTLQGTCDKTIIDPKNGANGITVTADDVTIKCLTIQHAGVNHSGIEDDASANLNVSSVTIYDANHAIYAGLSSATNGLQVTKSTIYGTGSDAIWVRSSSDAMVFSGNTLRDSWNYCFNIVGATNTTITHNTMTDCDNNAVYIAAGNANSITNNTITTTDGYGIAFRSSTTTVANNKISGAEDWAIQVGSNDDAVAADNATVKSNTVTASAGGIQVNGAAPDVEGNTVTFTTDDDPFDVYCTDTCGSLKIVSNTGSDSGSGCEGFDIVLKADATGGLVNKNTANDNTCYGFEIRGGNTTRFGGLTISNNKATGNGGSSYEAYGGIVVSYSNGDTLSGNTASGNGAEGLYVRHSANTTLTSNVVKGNVLDGIEIAEDSAGATLMKNTSTGNIGDGFNTDNHDTVFTNNSASGSGGSDCTYDMSEDGNAFTTSGSGNKCADHSNFTVESLFTDE